MTRATLGLSSDEKERRSKRHVKSMIVGISGHWIFILRDVMAPDSATSPPYFWEEREN